MTQRPPDRRKVTPKEAREDLLRRAREQAAPGDPLAKLTPRALGLRVGLPVALVWLVALLLEGWIVKAVAGGVTVVAAALTLWALRFATRSRSLARIVRDAAAGGDRRAALEQLETEFKKDDAAAVFARAQLELQEDPRRALATLESIRLERVMAPVADEARAQRAMIHLLLGETEQARVLADHVDLARHKDNRARATLAAIVAEAWARTGQARKAVDLLEMYDPADAGYRELAPQLLRARAFAYAWVNDTRNMRQTLRKLGGINPQLLSGFITRKKHPMGVSPKGVHPVLEREAFDLLMRSGAVERKMQFRRK